MSDHIIKALCTTLMHSLWQGILLAVITGAIIVFTKKATAAFRYNLLIGALTLFAVGVTVTFIYSTSSPTGDIPTTVAHAISRTPVTTIAAGPIAQPPSTGNITETVVTYLNTHYNIIVLIWFLIICAKSIQMAVGLYSVSHLKRTQVTKVGKDWEARLLQLAGQLRIGQAIQLMESGIAKVPMIVGHLKPVILVPIGMLNSLPANEMEAILIHELAHIRRRDYLVNLLQGLMEILFFFNPAVLWISQLIRTERENCCDDLAIAQSRNKANYIRAMVSCEEYKGAGAAYVMAFPGAKNTLFHRVSRLAGNRNYSLSLFEKTILAVCVVMMGVGITAFTTRENSKRGKINGENTKKAPQPVAPVMYQDARTAPLNQFRHPAMPVKDSVEHRATPKPPIVPQANPDTNRPALELSRAIAQELYRERLLTDTTNPRISLDDRELIVNDVRMAESVYDKIYKEFGPPGSKDGSLGPRFENKHPGPYDDFLQMQSEQIATELVKDNLVRDKNHFTYKLSRAELLIDGVRQSEELHRRIVDKYFKPDDQFNLNYVSRDPGSYAPDDLGQGLKRSQAEIEKKLVADLLHDGLITDPNHVSFSLNDKELIINGKKQSDEVYRKYKEICAPGNTGSGWNWTYSHHE